jgi:hypothetical protein
MVKHFAVWSCVGLLLTTPAIGVAQQPQDTVRNQVTLQGTVQAVDQTARTITVRGSQGNIVTLDVPTSVTRLDQVKVGDMITVSYSDRIGVRLHPAGAAEVDRVLTTTTTTAPGAAPGASTARERETTVTVTAWDPTSRVVSFTTPTGVSYTRRLGDTIDPTVVAGLKVGQQVDVTRAEASSVTMQFGLTTPAAAAPVAAAGAAVSTLDHRFTIGFQWGPDNSFSGDVIKAASGQTLSGIPVNMQDTSYDDVFGKMNLFKVGIGWRTTPRSEFLFNFRFGRSNADLVQIGTVGSTVTAPLNVQFSDYKYWGVEGGQRMYFTRARFTPFVGYLVGAIRYDDITSNFVDISPSLTPGLAAQDGKFFEKSWALTVGPTGGFLVGLGPIEALAEVQLQYQGKLSDVDWLVEEGLRNINDDSSRWSLPITFGARVRF